MSTPAKPPPRVRNNVKRLLFVAAGTLWALVHVAALIVTLATRIAMPVVAVLALDVLGAVVAGLVWLSRRIFPSEGERR